MKINEKIRIVRKTKRLSQVEVAKKANMSVTTYNMKERGNRPIKTEELERIANALNESPSIFFEDDFHETWNSNLSITSKTTS